MIYIVIAVVIVIGLYSIFKFRSDMANKESDLTVQGGIKKKYSTLISFFDNYDLHKKPQVLSDRPNDYELSWVGQSIITKLWFNEVHGNLWVRYTLEYNKQEILKKGVNLSSLPELNRKLEWKFPTELNQEEMHAKISQDINELMSELGA